MGWLWIYLVGVVIVAGIFAAYAIKSGNDITKRDLLIMVALTALSYLGLIMIVVAVVGCWFEKHGDEVVIKRKKEVEENNDWL